MVETTKPVEEKKDPVVAMREACDKHGPFQRSENGLLKFDDYVDLRKIITRQTARLFRPDKEKIAKLRIAAFKAGDDKEYFAQF